MYRTFGFVTKFFKIHFLPYTGLWLLLGVVLMTILKADKIACEHTANGHTDYPRACDFALTRITETTAMITFTFTTTLSIIGGIFIVCSFAQMLKQTHHTLMNIADPRGPFMPPIVWDGGEQATAPSGALLSDGTPGLPSRDRPVRRPVVVAGGFPWLGVAVQLILECLVFSFMTTLFFGSLPAAMALFKFIRSGHRMEYVTAVKPGSSGQERLGGEVAGSGSLHPGGIPLNDGELLR